MGIRLTLHEEISKSFRLMRTLFLTYGTKLKDVCVAIFHVWATNKAVRHSENLAYRSRDCTGQK